MLREHLHLVAFGPAALAVSLRMAIFMLRSMVRPTPVESPSSMVCLPDLTRSAFSWRPRITSDVQAPSDSRYREADGLRRDPAVKFVVDPPVAGAFARRGDHSLSRRKPATRARIRLHAAGDRATWYISHATVDDTPWHCRRQWQSGDRTGPAPGSAQEHFYPTREREPSRSPRHVCRSLALECMSSHRSLITRRRTLVVLLGAPWKSDMGLPRTRRRPRSAVLVSGAELNHSTAPPNPGAGPSFRRSI